MVTKLTIFLGVVGLLALSRGNQIFNHVQANLGYAYLNQNRGETMWSLADSESLIDAQNEFLEIVSGDPYHAAAWRALGFTYLAQHEEDRALGAWQNSSDIGQEFLAWASVYEKQGKSTQAISQLEYATVLSPLNGDVWFQLGRLQERSGQYEEARESYKTGLSQAEDGAIGHSDFYYRLGQIEAAQMPPAWDQALGFYDQALTSHDFNLAQDELAVQYARAVALRWSGRAEEALLAFEEIVEQAPGHYWANVHYGMLTWLIKQDADASEALLKGAVELDPELLGAYLNLARLYQLTDRSLEASQIYEQILRKAPDHEEARRQLTLLQELDDEN